jgi:Cu-processing system permease protein
MIRIIKFILADILKNRIVVLYTVFLAVFAWSVFSLEDNSAKGLLTMLNIILLTVPLVSILFSTIYIYNSAEFIELLLSQPIKRETIWLSLFIGLSLSMIASFLLGVGIPIIIYAASDVGFMMLAIGSLLSAVFVSIAFFSAILTRDKAKGIGISVLCWLYFALLFDGLILFLTFQFSDYPIEKIMVFVSALSPIDISRILILLHLDVSAMLGHTGAIFKDYFGTTVGILISFAVLFVWIAVPFIISLTRFKNKDL